MLAAQDSFFKGGWEGWEKWEGCEEGFAALRLPFGLPFGREHFVVAALRGSKNVGEGGWAATGVAA